MGIQWINLKRFSQTFQEESQKWKSSKGSGESKDVSKHLMAKTIAFLHLWIIGYLTYLPGLVVADFDRKNDIQDPFGTDDKN